MSTQPQIETTIFVARRLAYKNMREHILKITQRLKAVNNEIEPYMLIGLDTDPIDAPIKGLYVEQSVCDEAAAELGAIDGGLTEIEAAIDRLTSLIAWKL